MKKCASKTQENTTAVVSETLQHYNYIIEQNIFYIRPGKTTQ